MRLSAGQAVREPTVARHSLWRRDDTHFERDRDRNASASGDRSMNVAAAVVARDTIGQHRSPLQTVIAPAGVLTRGWLPNEYVPERLQAMTAQGSPPYKAVRRRHDGRQGLLHHASTNILLSTILLAWLPSP